MRGRDESLSIVERALAAAGGDEADAVLVSTDRNISRFANSSLHQNMSERGDSLTIRVVDGGRVGIASSSSIDDDEIRRVARLALDVARRSEPVQGFAGLFAGASSPDSGVTAFDDATAALQPREKALALRDLFARGTKHDLTFAGSSTTGATSVATGNSHGVRRWAPVTVADALVIAVGRNASGFATGVDRRASAVDLGALGEEAMEKALLVGGEPQPLEPGHYDVILEPAAIAEIFEWMSMITFSGQSYEDGSSFFVDHRDQKLLGANFTLADDALDPAFLPFPFDMEGVPKRRVDLVDRGIVRTPVVDKLMSDRLGLPLTGNAAALGSEDHGTPLHLSLAGGDATREELIASTTRGVWVTRFHYLNGLLDPRTALMTGMTRDGTFLVEEGKVTRRLVNLRWTQSMVEAFSNVTGMTRERRKVGSWWNPVGGTMAPTIRVAAWNVTGSQQK